MSRKPQPAILANDDIETLLNGTDGYAEYLARRYLYNLVKNTSINSPFAYRICSALESSMGFFGDMNTADNQIEDKKDFPRKRKKAKINNSYPWASHPAAGSVDANDWKHILHYFETSMNDVGKDQTPLTAHINLDGLCDYLQLKEVEREVLKFIQVAHHPQIHTLVTNLIAKDHSMISAIITRMIDRQADIRQVWDALRPSSPLTSYGILELSDPEEEDDIFPSIEYELQQALLVPDMEHDAIVEQILGKAATATLSTADFSDFEEEVDHICAIIESAVQQGKKGINILLYGPPGSGKTELAKAIAAKLELRLFAIGETDEANNTSGYRSNNEKSNDSTARHRVAKLLQAQSFLKGNKSSILFFDEIEDLLIKGTDTQKSSDTFNKVVTNRLFEQNTIVTLWAGNDLGKFEEPVRQRMSYSLYVGYPPVMKRVKIWERQLQLQGAVLPALDISYLARTYEAPARMIAKAIETASLTDMSLQSVERSLMASSRITYGHVAGILSTGAVGKKFDPDLISYDDGKDNYIKSIMASGERPRPYAMYAAGLPQSGIRSFAYYLAEIANMNVSNISVPELLAPNPQMTPAERILSAFQTAADNRSMLVVSHFDGFDDGSGKWDSKGLASYFMQCMMQHELPVIVTSYKPDVVLPVTIGESFSVSVALQPLDQTQCKKAFEIYFDKTSPDNMDFPDGLFPGDFSRVSKINSKNLNGGPSPEETLRMLKAQIGHRSEKQTFGFAGP